mmetsp:Transcript_13299/g.17047  ORF Transcript_13299/g.17047 Transcript_13299/m.17047 type:complete len:516 (+) Transcript_13299:1-1548(+)
MKQLSEFWKKMMLFHRTLVVLQLLPMYLGFLDSPSLLSKISKYPKDGALTYSCGSSRLCMLAEDFKQKVSNLESWLVQKNVKDIDVTVGRSDLGYGTGLIAKKQLKRNSLSLNIPQSICMSVSVALKSEIGRYIQDFEGWTGDVGVLAIYLLWEKSRGKESEFSAMIELFPSDFEHVLFWSESELEVAQKSSTKGIQGFVDDVVEDFESFKKNVVSRSPPGTFPPDVFNPEGFKWAVAIVTSRSFFVDQELRLVPLLDHANHQPGDQFLEPDSGGLGIFGGKSVKAVCGKEYKPGDEFFVSYGPKSPAEYLEEHGFVPDFDVEESSCALAFGLDEDDTYYDDKLDILETKGIDTNILFDIFSINNGEPDPEMVRYLRLLAMNVSDAFLFEGVFRDTVWDFMDLPVSQENEAAVGNLVITRCQTALDNMQGSLEADQNILKDAGDDIHAQRAKALAKIRIGERNALEKTMAWFQRDLNALDLKEYYQERRLKELGLDQPLDEMETMGSYRARDMDW